MATGQMIVIARTNKMTMVVVMAMTEWMLWQHDDIGDDCDQGMVVLEMLMAMMVMLIAVVMRRRS